MPITPADKERCQAEVPGNGPFTLGGEIGDPRNGYRVRCKNKPVWVATEKKPNNFRQERGTMSLCAECRTVFVKQLGTAGYDFDELLLEGTD